MHDSEPCNFPIEHGGRRLVRLVVFELGLAVALIAAAAGRAPAQVAEPLWEFNTRG